MFFSNLYKYRLGLLENWENADNQESIADIYGGNKFFATNLLNILGHYMD